jgi:uncharacterized membrane protein YdbT with pleckstrin-like domain
MIEIDDSERILRVVRKHWYVLVRDIILLCMLLALGVATLLFSVFGPIHDIVTFTGSRFFAGMFSSVTWLILMWIMAWNMWTDYFLDVLLITDRRIFDIEQLGLFRRTSASFRLDKVQNVTVDQKGFVATMLDFGTVRLETAGDGEDFIATYIAKPYEIKKFINEMQDRAEDRSQRVHFTPDTTQLS